MAEPPSEEWRDAMLVPIPKKGDLMLCDNWWGISLLDVVGKLPNSFRDVEDRTTRASRAFGTLCKPVFQDDDLSLRTKRMVYMAVVLATLLYGAETWANKGSATCKINNRCLRCILGLTRAQ